MLISTIDRNKESKPIKLISRISSSYSIPPTTNQGLSAFQYLCIPHTSEGTILRYSDTRLIERRKNSNAVLKQDRRIRDNRSNDSRWNTMSHHILVIALERKAGKPEPWKAGDHVLVIPSIKKNKNSKANINPIQKGKPALLSKDEEDYVLHLKDFSVTE